eukprot:CAMPEP_0171898774 /NCGR_PEP_ID=MMETSP0992-20121227/48900_1 /TAXON_ID=483369 /ORGANISM="non described non described, Strain CCMP2098" /LENGTH=83 /DNA_ID=CAMNT_0012527095 /DNA_START=56 /DNA_END=307 /DNA_ORIENTATION=+
MAGSALAHGGLLVEESRDQRHQQESNTRWCGVKIPDEIVDDDRRYFTAVSHDSERGGTERLAAEEGEVGDAAAEKAARGERRH